MSVRVATSILLLSCSLVIFTLMGGVSCGDGYSSDSDSSKFPTTTISNFCLSNIDIFSFFPLIHLLSRQFLEVERVSFELYEWAHLSQMVHNLESNYWYFQFSCLLPGSSSSEPPSPPPSECIITSFCLRGSDLFFPLYPGPDRYFGFCVYCNKMGDLRVRSPLDSYNTKLLNFCAAETCLPSPTQPIWYLERRFAPTSSNMLADGKRILAGTWMPHCLSVGMPASPKLARHKDPSMTQRYCTSLLPTIPNAGTERLMGHKASNRDFVACS